MKRYNPKVIEPKWQQIWEDSKIYQATEDKTKPKRYVLEYFPYPSGAAMHVGHVRNYTIGDAVARYSRMNGMNVLHPMGWDAFGLPAENYAIKTGISPQEAVAKNVENFKVQLMQMGFSYDWSREISSTDPSYYKWTQWFFLLLFKKGLAYQQESLQWWCPHDKTVLANEQVENGRCWRCGHEVEKKSLKQWFFKITDYADRLANDLDDVNWSEAIKSMQRNWIGRSVGAEIDFPVEVDLKDADFVFLHGYKGSNKSDFWPWLKMTLEKNGAKVFAPTLPKPGEPVIEEQVDFLLKNHKFSEKTILITHSLGSVLAMKLLPKLRKPIKRLIMIAPPLKTEFLDGKRREPLEKCCDWQFDFALVKAKAKQISVLADSEDDIVPLSHPKEITQNLSADLKVVVAQKPHFNADTEPAILEQLISPIKVFTTRPDTIFGATFLVLAPEHEMFASGELSISKEVKGYIKQAEQKSEIDRMETDREKTGVFTGAYAANPANGEKIPIWVADYVLPGYGTGAIMAVPAHDERDYEFAKKFDLSIKKVIEGGKLPYVGEGNVTNSGKYNDLDSSTMREKIVADLDKKNAAEEKINYKIRDWLISRQRYWGAPIPIIHCQRCGVVPVPEEDLPVVLPKMKSYEPSGDGRSPLANVPEFVNVKCPKCGGKAERETDTMDGFACSSWYFLRFADPHNNKKPFDRELVQRWLPVDDYIGGAEHAVMHLLYARFWTKVMFDEKLIDFNEPFKTLRNQGMILAPNGLKMSKSKGNTIEPDSLIQQGYGADSIRLMELFIGPWDQAANWSLEGLGGTFRFLQRVWTLVQEYLDKDQRSKIKDQSVGHNSELEIQIAKAVHKAIKKVSQDMQPLSFNTAIAALMECVNELYKIKTKHNFSLAYDVWRENLEKLIQLLAPFAPHIAEELWQQLGNKDSVHLSQWPTWDEELIKEALITLAVQVNGKVRGEILVVADIDEAAAIEAAKNDEKIAGYLAGKKIKKAIYVPGRLVSLVV